ncbi:MAG: HlyD family efflux transporter periplasmic adaptor subunit [Bacteroidales bacterium]|nr:HlyD family efflux transporter periplasmic adaptor subunit [Bacteroidales bacterium]
MVSPERLTEKSQRVREKRKRIMAEINKQEIRSQEMQEVMSGIPGSFLRWGLFLFFALIIAIITISWFISSPTVVTAPVIITTQNSPASLVAKSGGKIAELFVINEENVSEKQSIALVENSADYLDVKAIASFIYTIRGNSDWHGNVNMHNFPSDLFLGEVQSSYARFRAAWQQFMEYLSQSYIPTKLELLEEQIINQEEYTSELLTQKHLAEQDLQLVINNFKRDSLLYITSTYSISINEFEQSKQALLQKQLSFSSLKGSIKSNESATLRLKESRLDLQIKFENEMQQLKLELDEAFQLLQVSVNQWKEKYLIESPIKGKITFTRFWNENQVIKAGETLATVIPEDGSHIIARSIVPIVGFGRVKAGQEVNIKLSGFPYMEFGVLKGRIRSLSLVPVEGGYIAEIDLINGMRTSYNRDIGFIQEMNGTADIITDNNRLIYRFIKPLNALVNK